MVADPISAVKAVIGCSVPGYKLPILSPGEEDSLTEVKTSCQVHTGKGAKQELVPSCHNATSQREPKMATFTSAPVPGPSGFISQLFPQGDVFLWCCFPGTASSQRMHVALTCAEFSSLLSQFFSVAEWLGLVRLSGSSGDAGLSMAMIRDPDPSAATSPS